ncbi:MAG: helix-turn-helix domain-containing protein [Pseudomonadota bacterium]|nr:helix-turn-helix domain-containing protein [Pseudomonadota bacterium]
MKAENLDRLLCLLEVRLHAIGLCEVASGFRLKLPPTEDVLVHYVLGGSGVLRTEDGMNVPFRPDTLIFVQPGCSHEISRHGDEPQVLLWKETAEPLGEGMMRMTAGSGEAAIISACGTISADCGGLNLFEQLREPISEDVSGDRAVRSAFGLMLAEFREPRFGTRALTEALMKQCLVIALRGQIERGEIRIVPLSGLRDSRLLKGLLEMLEHPAEEHSLDELARISGMSRSLFAERFTETFQKPPMDLLRQIRLHRAANLLRSTELPIQIVAMSVGYASRSYFSRAFRAAYGSDPKAFREQARRAEQEERKEGQHV